jgi:GWxTD domain-containing protein
MKKINRFVRIVCLGGLIGTVQSAEPANPNAQILRNHLNRAVNPAVNILFDVRYQDADHSDQVFSQMSAVDLLVVNVQDWQVAGSVPGQVRLTLEAFIVPIARDAGVLRADLYLQSRSTFFNLQGIELNNEITDRFQKALTFNRDDIIQIKLHEIWPSIFDHQSIILARLSGVPHVSLQPLPPESSLIVKPVFSLGDSVSAVAGGENEYTTKSEQELDREFSWMEYLTTKQDKRQYKKLSLAEKQSFLTDFWLKHDQNPATAENEFKQEYLQRAKTAVDAFSSPNFPGIKGDRGRVMMLYGYPDEVERSTEPLMRMEVWRYYHVQGRVIFVFVDRANTGAMLLVHSTARGEVAGFGWDKNDFFPVGSTTLIDYRRGQR